MKTAHDWMDDLRYVVPSTDRWRWVQLDAEMIHQIQQDALRTGWRQGMIDASTIAHRLEINSNKPYRIESEIFNAATQS